MRFVHWVRLNLLFSHYQDILNQKWIYLILVVMNLKSFKINKWKSLMLVKFLEQLMRT